MADSFVARAREDDEPKCTSCQHAKRHHQPYGLCTGLGADAGEHGSFCHCASFRDPEAGKHSSYQGRSSTYRPGHDSRPRTGFSQSSSRTEIGDGKLRPRPNLQHERTMGKAEAEPDWMMFGVDNADGSVTVYASTKLSFLRLYQDAGHFDDIHRDMINRGELAATPWDIKGRMVDYVSVTAPTYNEAIQLLFAHGWRPDGEPSTADLQMQAALDEARRAEQEAHPLIVGELAGAQYTVPDDDDEIVDAEIVEDDEG